MCDTMVHVEPGRVLFAKNSDRDPNEAQFLDWQPRRTHEHGSTVRCTWIEIPQATETNAVLLSRPFWMWGAEMGANEHGVVIGNEAVFTRAPYRSMGLLGMDLIRLALERADSAEKAVEVIISLLETHGQGGGCGHEHVGFTYHNSFIVADPSGAVVLETAGDRWETERVTAGARSISNGLTIPGFAERYDDEMRTRVSACRHRQAHTQTRTAAATGPLDLMATLRSHGPGRTAPRWHWLNGAMDAPAMHAGGLVANSQTTASWVAELTPAGARHWVTATAAPDTSVFKPVRVDQPLDLGPQPDDHFDLGSLWWRHELLHRAAVTDPVRLYPVFADERDEMERRNVTGDIEPAEAFAEAGDALRRWTKDVMGRLGPDTRPWYTRRYWNVRNLRAGVPVPASW